MFCTIGLSHDVDVPIKYLRDSFYSWRGYLLDPNRDDYWRFEDIIEMEKAFGVRSTFYFCTFNRFDKIGHQNDVAYNIRSKKLEDVIKSLDSEGFSIGLHASINQYLYPYSFVASQNYFEGLLRRKVLGIRHHWWNTGPDVIKTFAHHYKAGFRYDTSLCEEERTGFLDNKMHPYYIGNTLEIPTFLEDAHMMYYKNTNFKDFKQWIERLINCNGVGCIDWHVRTSSPNSHEYKEWGAMYSKILKYLSNKSEVEVKEIDSVYKKYKEGYK